MNEMCKYEMNRAGMYLSAYSTEVYELIMNYAKKLP